MSYDEEKVIKKSNAKCLLLFTHPMESDECKFMNDETRLKYSFMRSVEYYMGSKWDI